MPKLPVLRHCVIAEQIRPEPDGRSTIIGFYGIVPYVSIQVASVPVQVQLSAYLICEPPEEDGEFDINIEVSGPSGILLPRTVAKVSMADKSKTLSCALNLQGMPVKEAGMYTLTVFNGDQLHSSNSFDVKVG